MEPRVGMVVKPPRGSGRAWLIDSQRAESFHLRPLGDDVYGFGGVKAIWRTRAELGSWLRVSTTA